MTARRDLRALELAAPAKLNLSLAVVGRRPNGLHELASTFALLDLSDILRLEPAERAELAVHAPHGEEIPVQPERNLAWRGLRAALARDPEARLSVEKRIPAAAGLGGGSSDAAAAWRLGRHWLGVSAQPTADDLEALAAIGADVPFFAAQLPAAEVRGIGERIAPTTVTPQEVVLVIPPFRLSTGAVFAELRRSEWSRRPEPGRNDLLGPARRLRPELDDLLRLAISAGGRPLLTGSGPTLYLLESDPERSVSLAQRLERAGLRVLRTRLAGRPASIRTMNEESIP
jgi:4-diphosphocytidyl-2-C-methyl-D-erythritol kinase